MEWYINLHLTSDWRKVASSSMKKVGKNLLSLLQGQKPEHFCDPSPVRSNVQNYYYSQNQKKTDSLKTELQNAKQDTSRLTTYL